MKKEVKPEEFGLEAVKAKDLTSGLTTTLAERSLLEKAYIDTLKLEITEDNLEVFRELRLKILKNRTQGIESWRVNKKNFFLTGGQFIDATAKMYKDENLEWEAKLLSAENFFENKKKKALEDLQADRVAQISPYLEDAEERDYSKFDEFEFEAILALKIKKFGEAEKLRKDEEAKAETLRIEEEARIEEARIEAERLKRENEEREAKRKTRSVELREYFSVIEDYNATLDLNEKDYKLELKSIKVKMKAKLQEEAKQAKIKQEEQRKLNEGIAEALKIKEDNRLRELAEKKKKDEADKKAADDKKLAEDLAKAPVKEQLRVWVETFFIEVPDNVLLNNDVALEIKRKFEAFKKWSLTQIENI